MGNDFDTSGLPLALTDEIKAEIDKIPVFLRI